MQVPTGCGGARAHPAYAARLRAWALERLPEWVGFAVVSEALYLGVRIGPIAGRVLWGDAIAKWKGRSLEIARSGTPASPAADLYRARALPTLGYIAQIAPRQAGVEACREDVDFEDVFVVERPQASVVSGITAGITPEAMIPSVVRRLGALGVRIAPPELAPANCATLAVARATSPHYVMLYFKTILNAWPKSARVHLATGVEPCVWRCADRPDSLGHYTGDCPIWQVAERRLGLPPAAGIADRLALIGQATERARRLMALLVVQQIRADHSYRTPSGRSESIAAASRLLLVRAPRGFLHTAGFA